MTWDADDDPSIHKRGPDWARNLLQRLGFDSPDLEEYIHEPDDER